MQKRTSGLTLWKNLCLSLLSIFAFSPELHAEPANVENVKAIARLYSAAFDRDPGISGLNFWVDSFEKGRSVTDIANDFYSSREFTAKYGPLTERQYVEQLYRNVLGRNGAQSGISFWVQKLQEGTSRAKILASFAGSPENVTKTSEVFANMHMEDGEWIFGSNQSGGTGSISGLIEEGALLLVDKQGNILRVTFAFGLEPNGDFNLVENFFTFANLPTNRSLSLYYIDGGEIYAVFGGTAGNPRSNVFSLSDGTAANLGLIGSGIKGEGRLVSQYSMFNQPGVVVQPVNARVPIGLERPPLEGLNVQELTEAGFAALFAGWVSGGNTYLEQVVAMTSPKSSPEADNARFYLAFSTLASIASESLSDGNAAALNRIGDILDLLGIPDDLRRGSPGWILLPEELDQNLVTAEQISDFYNDAMTKNTERAVELLSQVSPNFRVSWLRKNNGERVENDYGDALFFLGSLKFLQAYVSIFEAYDLDADLNDLAARNTDDSPTNDETVEQFLNNNPKFLSLTDRQKLKAARDLLILGAINNFQLALSTIESEKDSQDDDLVRLTNLDPGDITRTRNYLANIKNSVVQGQTLIVADDSGDRSKDVILNLKRFFDTGIDFRESNLMPKIRENELDTSRPCLPDPTFNGVVISPDLNSIVYDEGICN